MMKTCGKCGDQFQSWIIVDGKRKNLQRRKYCLVCSPYKGHNTRTLEDPVRTSAIWQRSSGEFVNLFNSSSTQSEMLRSIGLRANASNFKRLRERIEEEGLDLRTLEKRKKEFLAAHLLACTRHKKTIAEIFVKGKEKDNAHLKRRMVQDGLAENKCAICGLPNIWNGNELSLQLDHINGDPLDNEIENLRLLCPNCHSQTENFCGRNRLKNKCVDCGKCISSKAKRCSACCSVKRRKVERPEKEVLLSQIEQFGYSGTARIYGVSGNAIRKWL